MGLPQVIIEFLSNAQIAIERSSHGIVALIYNSAQPQAQIDEYKALIELGGPSKVICESYTTDVNEALEKLQTKKWNYVVTPDCDSTGLTTIKNWIISKRNDGKTYKAVLANTPAQNEGIINFTTTGIEVGEESYTTQEFTCRIAGIIAGTPLDHSVTFYPLGEVTAITTNPEPDTAINNGELILIDDGEKIKIGRGVNSLSVVTPGKTADYKKIKIIEGMDMLTDDIRDTFNNSVVGINNSYNNKCVFLSAINQYLQELEKQGVLYDMFDNHADIDTVAVAESLGSEAEGLTEEQLKQANTGSWVYLKADVQFQDALEDLQLRIYI